MVMHAMERLLVQQEGKDIERDRELDWEYDHLRESVRYAKMVAVRRKLDPDLAACAVAVQNIGRITFGRTEGHAELGYEPAKKLLTALGCFTLEEVMQLAAAVRNHSHKERGDRPLDELAKDVDIYVRYLQGQELTEQCEHQRLSRITMELGAQAR